MAKIQIHMVKYPKTSKQNRTFDGVAAIHVCYGEQET